VLIRSAVATFYARKDTATPVKAALSGVAVNVALKIALVGSLAQVGLAFATAVGAWINLLLVMGFAARRGFLDLDRAWIQSLAKFFVSGVVLAAALWLAARFAGSHMSSLGAWPNEAEFFGLIAVGTLVYAGSILLLFGKGWLRSLVRG
jgi:putative peptidoglycan lipid II flippase